MLPTEESVTLHCCIVRACFALFCYIFSYYHSFLFFRFCYLISNLGFTIKLRTNGSKLVLLDICLSCSYGKKITGKQYYNSLQLTRRAQTANLPTAACEKGRIG